MNTSCEDNRQNLGLTQCTDLPALPKYMITTPLDFKATEEEAASSTFWQNALLADKGARIYRWPDFVGFEDASEDTIYEETPLADLWVRDGKYRFRFHLNQSLCLHKAMFSHRRKPGRVFMFDVENQLIGTFDNTYFRGFLMQLLNTEKLKISDGSVASKTPVYVVLADNKEMDEAGAIQPASFFNTLNLLADVTITVVSASDTEIVVTVKVTCDNTEVEGLEAADFQLLDADGAEQTISGAVDDGDGQYTLSGTGLVTGTLKVLATSTYEGSVAISIGS